MAMILLERKEIEENGEMFIVETYRSDKTGKESVVKHPKPSEVTPESTKAELTQLERIEANTDYNSMMNGG